MGKGHKDSAEISVRLNLFVKFCVSQTLEIIRRKSLSADPKRE